MPLQVHAAGLRHIRSDKRVNEWRAPGRRTITKAATNERQVVIALSGGECIYFEQDAMGQLVETEKKEMSGDVACLDVGPVPEGRQRSRFLAVGSYDNTVSFCTVCKSVSAARACQVYPQSSLSLHNRMCMCHLAVLHLLTNAYVCFGCAVTVAGTTQTLRVRYCTCLIELSAFSVATANCTCH